jgi:hypothetical protein
MTASSRDEVDSSHRRISALARSVEHSQANCGGRLPQRGSRFAKRRRTQSRGSPSQSTAVNRYSTWRRRSLPSST